MILPTTLKTHSFAPNIRVSDHKIHIKIFRFVFVSREEVIKGWLFKLGNVILSRNPVKSLRSDIRRASGTQPPLPTAER